VNDTVLFTENTQLIYLGNQEVRKIQKYSLLPVNTTAPEMIVAPSAPPPPDDSNPDPVHNKSGTCKLKVLKLKDKKIREVWKTLVPKLHKFPGTIEDSPCWFTRSKDGRISESRVKFTFGYHVSAYIEHGREALESVSSNKTGPNAKTISHLCGNGPRCCNPDHIIIELKITNDERTHCMYVMSQVLEDFGYHGLRVLLLLYHCPHVPKCFHKNK